MVDTINKQFTGWTIGVPLPHPEQFWDPPSLISNGYLGAYFTGDKAAVA